MEPKPWPIIIHPRYWKIYGQTIRKYHCCKCNKEIDPNKEPTGIMGQSVWCEDCARNERT